MKSLIFLTTVFVFFLVSILPIALSFGVKFIPGGIQPSLNDTKKIYGQFTYYQSFVSPKDYLTGIGVSIKNPNFANKKNVFVSLYDGDNIIRKVILNGQNIADGKFVKLFFEPITDSLNKKFTWSIAAPDAAFDDALEVFLTDRKPLWSGEFRVNNEISEGSLSYVTLHKPKDSLEVLRLILSELALKLKADFVFFAIYGVLLLCVILYVLPFKSSKSQSRSLKIL